MKKHSSRQNALLCITACLLLIALSLSVLCAPLHADHDCAGDGCPVCALIQAVQHTLSTIALDSVWAVSAFWAQPCLLALCMCAVRALFVTQTPVTQKIKLSC